jgi:integrase
MTHHPNPVPLTLVPATPPPVAAVAGQVPALDDAAIEVLAEQLGQDPAMLRAQLLGTTAAPLVRDHIETYLTRCSTRTRATYRTALLRLRDGVGPVCDQTCAPCLGDGFICRCTCAACRDSRISVPALGAKRVSVTTYSETIVRDLAAISRRMAVKKGIVDNRRRATRSQVAKNGDGYGAEETTVGALRSLFEDAKQHTGGINHAKDVRKPRRTGRERRPMHAFELVELHYLTGVGGNDPELDTLMLDYGIATGARREGVYTLSIGQLHRERQVIDLRDKYKRKQPAPVSAELLDRLLAHAKARGGPQCDPDSEHYRPDAPVFWYKTSSGCRPVTERRIDYLIARWQRELPWANAEQLGFHHIRHTMASFLATMYGPQYKKRYLRHADGNVTDGYGVCTFEELARAMSDLLEFEHPLVHGVNDRRKETMRRLGLSDDD